jgi:hypothetical protein
MHDRHREVDGGVWDFQGPKRKVRLTRQGEVAEGEKATAAAIPGRNRRISTTAARSSMSSVSCVSSDTAARNTIVAGWAWDRRLSIGPRVGCLRSKTRRGTMVV